MVEEFFTIALVHEERPTSYGNNFRNIFKFGCLDIFLSVCLFMICIYSDKNPELSYLIINVYSCLCYQHLVICRKNTSLFMMENQSL